MACVFCKTGALGFKRNLSAAEILEQYYFLNSLAGKSGGRIANIVFMGMGEPLLNYDEVGKAVSILTSGGATQGGGNDSAGSGMSSRRITLSTSGVAQGIKRFADAEHKVRLAVSVTSAREELRRRLMPSAALCSLAELKHALLYYQHKKKDRVTLEAVLLKAVNTGREDAAALVEFARGLQVLVNVIPWNFVEGLQFNNAQIRSPSQREVAAFVGSIENAGLTVVRRTKKGAATSSACGQLGGISTMDNGNIE